MVNRLNLRVPINNFIIGLVVIFLFLLSSNLILAEGPEQGPEQGPTVPSPEQGPVVPPPAAPPPSQPSPQPAPVVQPQPVVVVQPAPVVVQPVPAQPVTQTQNTQVTTVQNNRQTTNQDNNQDQSNNQNVSVSSSSSATGGSADVNITQPAVSGEVRVVTAQAQPQVVQVAGVTTEVKELPKTGLPVLAWAALAFIPAGFKIRGFSKVNQQASAKPHFLWEERQFKTGA